jgi:ParB family chromosome partitioning protein
MAKAAKKIVFSRSRDIPFSKLVLSESNVRRVKPDVNVEELAEDIARREDLVQGLNVRAVLDADGNESGMFEVPAGGRRYRAIARLVKAKRFPKDGLVPCIVRDPSTRILAEDDSLAENVHRIALHPLDQFRAFSDMREKGMSDEEIAVAFFTTAQVVKQRLRLASVSQALLDVYADNGMTLETLMAFTVNPDHQRQEQVWEAIQHSSNRQPWQIRQMLTETTVPASDKRALFVGVDAYVTAGGTILRDLFEDDEGGWLENVPLLDRLVSDKFRMIADEVANEGWKWITADLDLPYGYDHGLRALTGTFVDLTDEERTTREALREEQARLEAEYQGDDELPDEIDARLGEIEAALEVFEKRPVSYEPVDIARAGVFVSIDRDGDLVIDRGYVRPEDELPVSGESDHQNAARVETESDGEPGEPTVQHTVITIGGQPAEQDEEDEGDTVKPLPEKLVAELTAHRTLALRDAVGANPHVALTALLHKLVRDTFRRSSQGAAVEVSVREVHFREQGKDLADSAYAQTVSERHQNWKGDLPTDDDALWDWIAALDDASRLALLAHCVAYGINALYERPNPFSASGISQHGLDRRMAEATRLVQATGLDMVEAGFRPTVENYLGRVTKPRILEAVREGAGERAADLIAHLKKGEMAKEAERLLAETGWLPEPLRLLDAQSGVVDNAAADAEAALPEFLADDDTSEDSAQPHVEAAE